MAMRNLITDVAGLSVGCAHDERLASGVTVIVFDEPAVASVSVLGGAPSGRELGCLEPDATVEFVDAVVLCGGSAYGLDAASGAQAWLRARGRGHPVRTVRVPIVPQAIIFDLLNGGDKDWGRFPPYRELAHAACEAAGSGVPLGTVGGGFGATTVNLKGGQGSASARTSAGYVVAALVLVNAIGSAVIGDGPHFWAAPWEEGTEFGGLGAPQLLAEAQRSLLWKGGDEAATTIALVATDAILTKAQAKRLAIIAQGGLSKSLRLAHAMFDGDTVFAAATGRKRIEEPPRDLVEIGALASDCLARAVARAVYEATSLPFPGALPSWRDKFRSANGGG
jgi:L-aminopeptidase/D-esterase-like protein